MVNRRQLRCCVFLLTLFLPFAAVADEQAGGIRGIIYDKDFEAPLAAAQVLIAETQEQVNTSDEGNFIFSQVVPGTYTLVFSKDGYTRQVKANVVVSPGRMTETDAWLSGEFTEMEEFVVQDVQIGTGTEAALLNLRMESPALIDSISSELMGQAGAGDAASALKLVSGATVQDGKYAVIRGLPDRYVNSQMNGVRLPTADADKRAVQLDQFPSAIIESIQVTKTFTPDQQGDASGGAVNIVLKGIPSERVLKIESGISWNTNVAGNDKFMTYKGGGLNFFGMNNDRGIPSDPSKFGAAGASYRNEPTDYKWSVAFGDKYQLTDDIKVGGFGSFFYERDSSFYQGIDDQYYGQRVGDKVIPKPYEKYGKTSLFDVTKSSQQVKWGILGALGLETENHSLTALYMYTRDATDKVTFAEDTRGKKSRWPDYDPYDPSHVGNNEYNRETYPYRRSIALEYTERSTRTIQLHGKHKLFDPGIRIGNILKSRPVEFGWTYSWNSAGMYQPDKRLFAAYWLPESADGYPAEYKADKGANTNLGNFHRIWKEINEDSKQWSINIKIPFEQWSGDEGYFKLGWFNDEVTREYKQESFSNSGDIYWRNHYWYESWANDFPSEGRKVNPSYYDADYNGEQNISAFYYMADIPFSSIFKIIGGYRFESTELSIKNNPDRNPLGNIELKWYDPETGYGPIFFTPESTDVTYKQNDILPMIGFEFKPFKKVTLHGSYSETVARQTFKELSPIMQVEYTGGPVFVGNPGLTMSALKNYDLRLDWTPYEGGMFSTSYFVKKVENPIEFSQGSTNTFSYTYPINYPKGELSGFEFELRQDMGYLFKSMEGLAIGANATFIDSEVTLPALQAQYLKENGTPEPTRKMSNAPEHLYNFFLTYNMAKLGLPGTDFGIFYTIRGETLVAGASTIGGYRPDVFETEYGTLNLSLSHKIGKSLTLKFQAKNLFDPDIETVYRFQSGDVTKTSYQKGREFSLSLSATF